jgi:RNA polymerase primary sigma factor
MNKKRNDTQTEDSLQTYFAQIRKIPLLSFEEELELSKRIHQGDESARKKFIEANLRLVVKIAHAYVTQDMPFIDIIQEGNLGLMHAVEKYDHLKQVRFSTYAGWWIRQFITRSLSNKRRAIRLPHRKEQILQRIQRSYHTLSQTLMHKPNSRELAAEIGVPVEEIEFILHMTHNLVSLDMDTGNDDSLTIVDLQEDYTYSPERAFLQKSSRAAAIRSLNILKDREKRILMYRYQLNDGERYTLKKISDKMGISPETVRQIEMKALKKMKRSASAEELRRSMLVEAM